MGIYSKSGDTAFIQCADFVGAALKAAAKNGIKNAVIVSMMGKLSKMADGQTQTHISGSSVNMELLSQLAKEIGAPEKVQNEILDANTGRHVLEICDKHNLQQITDLVCKKTSERMMQYVDNKVTITTHMVDFVGLEIAKYQIIQG